MQINCNCKYIANLEKDQKLWYSDVMKGHDPKAALKNIGSKITGPRLLILEIFEKAKRPLFTDELADKITGKMDLSTLYRILAFLEKEGYIHKLHFSTDKACYELANQDHHHHIVCESCGEIEDIDSEGLESALRKAAGGSKKFRTISRHSLEFFGFCRSCEKVR